MEIAELTKSNQRISIRMANILLTIEELSALTGNVEGGPTTTETDFGLYTLGSTSDDNLYGSDGVDLIVGGDGQDYVEAGDGNDTVVGGSGNDEIYVQAGDDEVYGGTGDDWIDGGDGEDYIEGGFGDDTLIGHDGNDEIYGGDGNDIIDGEEGDDWVDGESGDDTLFGGAGEDTLVGGAGVDTFVLNKNAGADIIDDFMMGDKLQISASEFGGGLTGSPMGSPLSSGLLVVGAAATDSIQRFVYNQGSGELFFDVDGSGSATAIKIATLSNSASLSGNSFSVIGIPMEA
jgi:serralysin